MLNNDSSLYIYLDRLANLHYLTIMRFFFSEEKIPSFDIQVESKR